MSYFQIEMPDDSNVLIYQADRKLTYAEQEEIKEQLNVFISGWQRHGHALKASFDIRYDYFIVLYVDPAYGEASGCSIDSLVNKIRELGSILQMDFLNNSNIAFLKEEEVQMISFSTIRRAIENELITQESMLFKRTVAHLGEFKNNWIVPVTQSWLSRYFRSTSVPKI
jgi:hypothetical protein